MNKHLRKVVVILGLGALIASLFGCSGKTDDPVDPTEIGGVKGNDGAGDNAVENESGLAEFSYSYSGSVGGGDRSYSVTKEDGVITFEYSNLFNIDYGDLSCQVKQELLDELYSLYIDQNIARWDGFDKTNSDVLDGYGFSVYMAFEDGGTLTACGSNASPEGYSEFEERLEEIFAPYVEELESHANAEKIEKGVSGNLDSIMVTFKQHGESGDDEYNINIYKAEDRENNFDVTIKSVSGEFFEAGRYRYYCSLEDEAIDFEGFQEIIEKYDLVKWMGYDETAENYNDCEWFQLDFSFSEDGYISAMGTEHPENYDQFRSDFLKHLADVIGNAEKNYGLEEYK